MTDLMRRYGGSILLLILAFAYVTRLYNLNIPEGYMFDEVYHAVTAKLIANNDPRAFEWWNPPPEPDTAVDWLHPPLAKYFQAASILAFGENSFGWRFSSVLFGILVIVVTYHLARQLFKNEAVALSAAALASLDGLLLVQSRIAMNDIFVVFFILLTLLFYAKFRDKPTKNILLAVGVCAGLAMASKWSGLFVLALVWVLEGLRLLERVIKNSKNIFSSKKNLFKRIVLYTVALLVIPAVIYVGAYLQMFLQGKDWQHFKELHNQIFYYQTHLKENHPYESRPWQWALDIRPVWYHVQYLGDSRADVYALGNPLLFIVGLGTIIYTLFLGGEVIFRSLKTKAKNSKKFISLLHSANSNPLFFLGLSYFFVWLPWQFSPRIMFFYHYAPAVPILCIILAYWLVQLYKHGSIEKILSIIIWLGIIFSFVAWYPQWVGIPIPTTIKDNFYFAITSWR